MSKLKKVLSDDYLDFFAINMGCKDVLVLKLEVLEVYGVH